jgi:hypothetical protein
MLKLISTGARLSQSKSQLYHLAQGQPLMSLFLSFLIYKTREVFYTSYFITPVLWNFVRIKNLMFINYLEDCLAHTKCLVGTCYSSLLLCWKSMGLFFFHSHFKTASSVPHGSQIGPRKQMNVHHENLGMDRRIVILL